MNWILQSERLNFRKLTTDDFGDLCNILQDIDVMYAWEHAFSDEEVHGWIDENLRRYADEGYSYFAAIEKNTDAFIGVIGPLIETINDEKHIGVAYILNKIYWGQGYATEGAYACMQYAFSHLSAKKVIAEIRPENLASCNVAKRLGMKPEATFTKRYQCKDMPHFIYARIK